MSTTDSSIRNEIKSYIAASGWSLVDIVPKMSDSRPADEQTTPQTVAYTHLTLPTN